MNEVTYKQVSSTVSTVLFATGLFAAQIPQYTPHAREYGKEKLVQQEYSLSGNKPTFNNFSDPITGKYTFARNGFEQTVGDFYAHLLTSQKPLGAEFEKVLYENLWDLYES